MLSEVKSLYLPYVERNNTLEAFKGDVYTLGCAYTGFNCETGRDYAVGESEGRSFKIKLSYIYDFIKGEKVQLPLI